ncbi:MAG: glucodextranase DOMON-like domain-containing protein [Pirellulales bacterium]
MNRIANCLALGLTALILTPAVAAGQVDTISFKDPVGDDNGPGSYTYPTDEVYTKGSFDPLNSFFNSFQERIANYHGKQRPTKREKETQAA